ncbi:amidohydrolase [Arvimicrobium flavum]|uniref:amidohydrolase n=1 Tax=Arvimicrobium flavum TaxID=3393320 RepID=UPI00237BDB63|nr:amidohydrolase [Mesorhizobium shangrilense]
MLEGNLLNRDDLLELTVLRRDLHRHPELLYDLPRTSGKVADELSAIGCDEIRREFGETGVVATIRGSKGGGRMIGLRADMDALPISETTGAEWQSERQGLMHACGHDGHTSTLLGAARVLARHRDFEGTVVLIFQPAEEGGAGAKRMIDDGFLDAFPLNEVYGMHNLPGLDVGSFAITAGPAMASIDSISVTLKGRGGHAASPHLCDDVIVAMGALVQGLQTIVARRKEAIRPALLSLTSLSGGNAFNVMPEAVTVVGTSRCLDEGVRGLIEQRLRLMAESVAAAHEIAAEVVYERLYPVTVNELACTANAVRAASAVSGQGRVNAELPPTMAGEDFAFFLQHVPGAMIRSGNGPSKPLHNPGYDFNDAALEPGIAFWNALVADRLGGNA